MQAFICDRCGKPYPINKLRYFTIYDNNDGMSEIAVNKEKKYMHRFDICPSCILSFAHWIDGKEIGGINDDT